MRATSTLRLDGVGPAEATADRRRSPGLSRITRIAAVIGASALLIAALAAASVQPSANRIASVVTWRSGVYPGSGFDSAAAKQFASYRGRPLGIVTVFLDSRNWGDISYSDWAFRRYAGFDVRLAVALPLTVRGTPLRAVAEGRHDWAFRRFAQVLLAEGRGTADIRLGWEFNGSTYPWMARNPAAYIAAFRHVSSLLNDLLPRATIDWNGAWGKSKTGLNPFTKLYPGDAFVDVVGMDGYDQGWVPADSADAFRAWTQVPFGIDDWATFAALHHKKFAVPEWGLTATGGGDDRAFVAGMFHWFSRHAHQLAYEAYFNEPDGAGRAHNSLSDPVEMPASSSTYRKLWG